MISVVIPAHNEEEVIARSIGALIAGASEGELEVIVACNGCRDRTADVARSCGAVVRVIETEIASKAHALNLGDDAATGWPRFYVDADVVLSLDALRKMAALLKESDVLAVAPDFNMELTGCSWPVRAFFHINDLLPSSREGIGTSGVYGLSELGRRRFQQFPQIIADDAFVRIQFRPEERKTERGCWSTVFAPRALEQLIAIKSRSHFGTWEVRRLYPQLWANMGAGNVQILMLLGLRPWLWPKLAVYGYVKVLARLRAIRRLRAGDHKLWERDQSSRQLLDPVSSCTTGEASRTK